MGLRERFTEAVDLARLQAQMVAALPVAAERKALLKKLQRVRRHVPCPHNESHVLSFLVPLLRLPQSIEGVIVEAGCFRGGSTAKLSLVAAHLGRQLVVFDSFAGLPPNDEPHEHSILGHSIQGWFKEGAFCGALSEVRANVEAYGDIRPVRFIPGWFADTLPPFDEKICAAYLDVDLAASTRTCS